MTRRRRTERSTPLMAVAQATAAYVVIVAATVYFLLARPSAGGTVWYWPAQLNAVSFVLLAAFGLVLVYKWRRALADHRATTAAFRNREQLASLNPEQFERWCQSRLTEAGYRTKLVGGQADHGIDLEVERDGRRIVVQCKRYAGQRTVGEPQLRDLYGAMHSRGAVGAIAITAGHFTTAAHQWAAGKPIELWDVGHLARLSTSALVPAVPPAAPANVCPNCGAALVQRRNRTTQETFFGCSTYPRCRFTAPAR